MRTGALSGLPRRRWVSPQRGLPAHEALRVATRTPPRHNLYWNLPLNHLLFSGVLSTAGPNPPGFRGRPLPVRKPPRQARNVYGHPWSFGGHCQLSGLYPLARSALRGLSTSELPREPVLDAIRQDWPLLDGWVQPTPCQVASGFYLVPGPTPYRGPGQWHISPGGASL